MLEKIMAENCAELKEANNSQNQDSKQIPSERNKNKFLIWIYHKLQKPKYKEKNHKSNQREKKNPFKEQQQD